MVLAAVTVDGCTNRAIRHMDSISAEILATHPHLVAFMDGKYFYCNATHVLRLSIRSKRLWRSIVFESISIHFVWQKKKKLGTKITTTNWLSVSIGKFSRLGGGGGGGIGVGGGGDPLPNPDMQTQPAMLTLKQFLATQDDSISDSDAIEKYNEYKVEFKRQQLNEFFVAHKDEEW